jgi:predicted aspartyl protease
LLETVEIDDDDDASVHTDSSYSGTELVYELQDEGSYSDIRSPLHLMTIDEEEEEEDPPEPTTELPLSEALAIYDAEINGTPSELIIDTGATTYYVGEDFARKQVMKIHRIKPRRVRIADKDTEVATGVVKTTVRVAGAPAEVIIAYTFPLKSITMVLGLPWLKKHNPHIDFQTMSIELTNEGRRYYLYPRSGKPQMQFRVIPATDLIQYTPKKQASMMDHKERQYHADQMKRWIHKHHLQLLRAIGIPSRLAPFTVDTGEQKPIRIPPRLCSPRDLALIKKFLEENQANGVLERAESPWSAPLVLAPKPDGKTRVYVDYRALNAITKKDAHPLPRIDESMARFADAKHFTTLDMKSGYWQIALDPLAKQKLAFSTRYG